MPFQKGTVKARYRNENLDLLQIIGTKEKANIRMQGTLDPRGGSELRFDSDDFKIRDLALDPNLDILQNGLVSIDRILETVSRLGVERKSVQN